MARVKRQERDLLSLLRLRSGDSRALGELYDRHAALLHRVMSRILGTTEPTDDLLRSLWLDVWRGAVNYQRHQGTVEGWLVMLARNRALERARERPAQSEAKKLVESSARMLSRSPASPNGPDLMSTLEPLERQALEIAFFEGVPPDLLAAKLEVPADKVKAVLRRGLERLHERIPEEERV